MADDKAARNDQADREDRRQREREIAQARKRGDEPEPPIDDVDLAAVAPELDAISYPATGGAIVNAVGEEPIETPETTYRVEDLLPAATAETFESSAALRVRLRRPTIATAMKHIVEAIDEANASFGTSQRDAYERTFDELVAIDAVDEDEGIAVVQDWIVDQITENGTVPGSRAVRRRAAKFCRQNGYTVRNDEWLGV